MRSRRRSREGYRERQSRVWFSLACSRLRCVYFDPRQFSGKTGDEDERDSQRDEEAGGQRSWYVAGNAVKRAIMGEDYGDGRTSMADGRRKER